MQSFHGCFLMRPLPLVVLSSEGSWNMTMTSSEVTCTSVDCKGSRSHQCVSIVAMGVEAFASAEVRCEESALRQNMGIVMEGGKGDATGLGVAKGDDDRGLEGASFERLVE